MKEILNGIKSLVLSFAGLCLAITVFFTPFIIPLFPIMAAVFVIYFTRTQRKLLKTKETPIYNLTGGLVKIQGTVEAPEVLESPFFKEQCISYSYEKAKLLYSDEGEDYVASATQTNKFQDFYLINKTGKIKIITNYLNLWMLPPQVEQVRKIRHTQRTLKNGDLINILGYAVQNEERRFELRGQPKKPLIVGTVDIDFRTQKGLNAIRNLLPYIILMYIAVNYFLFFAPVKVHLEKNTPVILFLFFGMPILSILFTMAGNRQSGASKLLFSNLMGICIGIAVLTFPLLCLLFITETEFYRILCIWVSVFCCTILAAIMNYNRLDKIFLKDGSSRYK
ncbi:hypothetical protein [Pedobacter caeni]|uniref:Uncharacterized protein n=1 Tax=Pedobacter caeni TaxID=288992 RepID=A0A1M4TBR4_9SPHI|nr:hypothetical protein [Pedobacter caeni]SHE41804.1 hypothetical protein SAMN04488522_101144 [Pedobacter caeni]